MEHVQNGKVVGIHYTLKNASGEIIDQSSPLDPLSYLHGFGNIVVGLEKALDGLKIGDKKSVVVEAHEGYGDVIEELKMVVDRSSFPSDAILNPGMQFQAQVQDQFVPFMIEKVEGNKISVNGNHPLAGEKLFFDIEIISLREASGEEKEHGHPHGPGGHSH